MVKAALLAANKHMPEYDQAKLFPGMFPDKPAAEYFNELDLQSVEWMVPESPQEWEEISKEFRQITVALNEEATLADGTKFKLDNIPDFGDVPKLSPLSGKEEPVPVMKPTTLDFSGIPDAPGPGDVFDNEREWL